jgi:hypothetical protein
VRSGAGALRMDAKKAAKLARFIGMANRAGK